MVVVKSRIDENGRVYIPSSVREQLELDEGSVVDLEVNDEQVIIVKGKSIAEESRGVFKIGREITDVDKVLKEISRKKVKKWTT